MRILYLTPNHENYSAAYYQNDFINSLRNKVDLILWGPGYNEFDKRLNLEQVFNKFNLHSKDILCVGHGWLSDIPQNSNTETRYKWNKNLNLNSLNDLEYCAKYNFSGHQGRKICILNKEYVSLKKKLNFIKNGNFDLAFSHYSNCEEFEKISNTKFIFFPFAVNNEKFKQKKIVPTKFKKFDLCFSGLLQNPYIKSQNKNLFNLRNQIQKKLFIQPFGIPIFLKNNYKNKSIYWNSYQDNNFINLILKLTNKYQKLSFNEYVNMFKSSKATLNTLSPYNLIGPRYFECMLMGSINFCQKSKYYSKIFNEFEHYIPFKINLSDFKEKLDYATSDSLEIKHIIEASHTLVVENHTYDKRVKDFIEHIRRIN